MNSYIRYNFIAEDVDEKEIQKQNTKLLERILPTVETQNTNDTLNLERCVSTTTSYVKANYSANELKTEYNRLRDEVWPDHEDLDLPDIPKPEARKTKQEYTDAIIKARSILIKQIPHWKEQEQERIQKEIDERKKADTDGMQGRLEGARDHAFYHLWHTRSTQANAYNETHDVAASNSEPPSNDAGQSAQFDFDGLGDIALG